MSHVMIDLETLGTQPGSIILSIGAVIFDPMLSPESCVLKDFYCVVGRANSELFGLTHSEETLAWWGKQSPEARQVLTDAEDPEKYDLLPDALTMLAEFIPANSKIWSNGANFDQPLLDVAYSRCDIALPWKYYNSRCYRTILALYPYEKSIRPVVICAHNALEDAKWQAIHMTGVVQALKLKHL